MIFLAIIYLDNNASTKVDPRVLETMLPFFSEHYANPSNIFHIGGEAASSAIDHAKDVIAEFFGITDSNRIFFTSGATESNNLAIRGVIEASEKKRKHIITSNIEHDSVLSICKYYERHGTSVTYVAADSNGFISPSSVEAAVCDDTVLISIMAANNEIGTIQPIDEVSRVALKHNIPFHCDATQYISLGTLDLTQTQIDLLTFSAHKIYGAKGVGGLYVNRNKVKLTPLILGGHQQFGIRSGTYNTPGIIGMAEAIRIIANEGKEENQRIGRLRNYLLKAISSELNVIVNGSMKNRIPSNLNITIPGVPAIALAAATPNVMFSFGSACSASNNEASHVLRAIRISPELSRCSIRLSLGRFSTEEDINIAAVAITNSAKAIIKRK